MSKPLSKMCTKTCFNVQIIQIGLLTTIYQASII
nr:MAG TPA: hypothetical protein [Caudoviricetes sp.]